MPALEEIRRPLELLAFFVLEILPAFFVVELVDLVLEFELEHGLEEPEPLEDGLEVAVDQVLEHAIGPRSLSTITPPGLPHRRT